MINDLDFEIIDKNKSKITFKKLIKIKITLLDNLAVCYNKLQ